MGAGASAALTVVMRLRDEASASIAGVRSRLQGFGQQAAITGGLLTAGVTLPLIAIAKQAFQTAGDFEQQMNILTVAARASGTSLADLSKAALLVGADTQLVGINSAEAADAMTNFYKAGLNTTEIFGDLNTYLAEGTNLTGALRAAIDLAAASDLDLNAASEVVAVSMATFGLSAADATSIANSFVGAADASTAEVGDLVQAMANVGPTAAQFRWSLEDVNTALAILSTRGITGAEAGTSLKSMMTNLMRPTADVTGALDAMGISLYDQNRRMLPLPAIISQLSAGMAGMSEEQRNATIQTLAGTYGMKAMSTLLAEGTVGWDNMTTAIGAAATAQEVGAARTKGLNAVWEQFKGTLETIYITVGLPLIQNFLTPFIQKITELAARVLTMNPAVINAALAFLAVLAAAGPVILAVGVLATVLGFLLSPIGLVLAALALLAAAWASDFGGIREKTAAVIEAVRPHFEAIKAWLQVQIPAALATLRNLWESAWAQIQAALATAWSVIGPALAEVWKWLQTNIPLALATLRRLWETTWPVIKNAVTTAWGIVSGVFTTVVTWLQTNIPIALATLRGIWETIWPKIKEAVITVWNAIGPAFTNVRDWLQTHIPVALRTLRGLWEEIWPKIKDAVTTVWDAIGPTLISIRDWLQTHVPAALKTLRELWEEIWPKIKDAVEIAKDAIGDAIKNIREWLGDDGIKGTIKDLREKWVEFTEKAQAAWDALVIFFGPTVERISKAFKDLKEDMEPVKEAFEKLKEVAIPVIETLGLIIGGVVAVIVKLLGETLAAALENIGKVAEGAMLIITGAFEIAQGIIEGVIKIVKALLDGDFSGAWKAAQETVEKVAAGFGTAIEGAGKVIDGVLGTIWDAVTNTANDLLGTNLPKWQEFKDEVKKAWDAIWTKVSKVGTDLKKALGELADKFQPLIDVGKKLVDLVKDSIIPFFKALQDVGDALKDKAIEWVKFGLAVLLYKMQVIGDYLSKTFQPAFDLIKSTFDTIATLVRDTVTAALQSLSDKFTVVKPVADIFAGAMNAISGAISAISGAIQSAITWLGELAAKIGSLPGPPKWLTPGSPTPFELGLRGISAALIPVVGGLNSLAGALGGIKGIDAAKEIASGLATIAEATVKTAQALQDFQPVDNLGVITAQVLDFLIGVEAQFKPLIEAVDVKLTEKAQGFADGAGAVVGLIADAVEAMATLPAVAEIPPGLGPYIERVNRFLATLVGNLALWADKVSGEAQAAAKTFAENAGPVVDLIEGAVAAMAALPAVAEIPTGLGDYLNRVDRFLITLVGNLAAWSQRVSVDAQVAAKAFAENAGPVVDLVESAVGAMAILPTVADIPTGLGDYLNRVDRFLITLVGNLAAWSQRVGVDAQQAAATFAENAQPVVDLIESAVGAMAALPAVAEIPTGLGEYLNRVSRFLITLIGNLAAWSTMVAEDLQTAARTFAENAGPVVDVVGAALELILSFQDYIPVPNWDALTTALAEVAEFIEVLVRWMGIQGRRITEELQGLAKTFAENASPVLDTVSDGLDLMLAFQDYVPVPNWDIATTALAEVAEFIEVLVRWMGIQGKRVSEELQGIAKNFAENAGPVLGIVSDALAAILAISKYVPVPDWDALTTATAEIADFIEVLVRFMGIVGKKVTEELQGIARAFAENAGPVLGIVKAALENITAFAKYVPVPDWDHLTTAIAEVGDFIEVLVRFFGIAGKKITEELQGIAKAFAENAAPVLGIVKVALESITAISTWVPIAENTDLTERIDKLTEFIGLLIDGLEAQAGLISEELQKAARTLAENAAPVLNVVKAAIDTIVAISNWIPAFENIDLTERIDKVTEFIGLLIDGLSAQAGLISEELQKAARTLAENAAPVLGVVKSALEVIAAISNWIPAFENTDLTERIDKITEFIEMLVEGLGAQAGLISGDLQKAAKTLAETAIPVLNVTKTALEVIVAVSEYVPRPDLARLDTAMGQIAFFIQHLIKKFGEAGALVSEELQTAAKAFAATAGPVLGVVKGALESILAISEGLPVPNVAAQDAAMKRIADFIRRLITKFGEMGVLVSEELQATAKAFAATAGPVLGVVKGALEAITAISEGLPVPNVAAQDAAMKRIADFIRRLTLKFGEMGTLVSEELQGAAKAFAATAGPVMGVVKGALEALDAITEYVTVPTGIMDDFVADMLYIVTKIAEASAAFTKDGLTQAQAFATAANAVAAMLKTGQEGLVGEKGIQFYHEVSHAVIDLFVADMAYVVGKLIETAALFTTEGQAAAVELATTMQDVGKALANGVSGLIKPQGAAGVTIADYAGIAHDIFDLFIADMAYVVGIVAEAAGAFTSRGLTLALEFAKAGQDIFDAISKGVKAVIGVDAMPETGGFADTMSGIVTATTNATASMAKAFRDLPGQIRATFGDIAAALGELAALMAGLLVTIQAGAYNAGVDWANSLAAGIRAGLPAIEAALAAVAALFPHSPAKTGPLSRPPDWETYLSMGLGDAAARVAQVLGSGLGLGGHQLTVAPVGGGGARVAPIGGARGRGATVINFTYAPAVSLASQREAQEVIAPMLAEVTRREARRG